MRRGIDHAGGVEVESMRDSVLGRVMWQPEDEPWPAGRVIEGPGGGLTRAGYLGEDGPGVAVGRSHAGGDRK